jgi:hypothetical protein
LMGMVMVMAVDDFHGCPMDNCGGPQMTYRKPPI